MYNPDTADNWKAAVQHAILKIYRKPIIKAPIYFTVDFFFHRGTGLHGKIIPHAQTPDDDNLIKSTMDAITDLNKLNMGIWKDDALVYGIKAEKYLTPWQSGAQIMIEVWEE
jgi:Holliday junction resolvase RusA-like endonuclease